jgi:predicted TIM-barrel fold metal-dependent hydrolase
MAVTIPTSDFAGMSVGEFDTRTLLAHAADQARERKYNELFIVDVDSHHYESDALPEILEYFDNPVLRQIAKAMNLRGGAGGLLFQAPLASQDMGGRVGRYILRHGEKFEPGQHKEAQRTVRWMDAIGTDIAMLFPTPMLLLSAHPVLETQTELAFAYNRWLVERVLSAEPRLRSMLYLPFHDPDACYRMVMEFGDKKGVSGFLVTATHNAPVQDNRLMRVYAALEERGLPLAFHGGYNMGEKAFASMNRFISVHSLGFVFYNLVHMTNWVINGLPERFPKLKVIWMESGLSWIPFLMQRLDNEYMMRSNEAPQLKRLPSEYMREMYYSTQPMERTNNLEALQLTMKMINAETQLMYSSDYPHWDFDLPSTIYDLPFLSEHAKKNILGETARNVFNLGNLPKLAKIPAAP